MSESMRTSSEDYSGESDLELDLGLSLGGGRADFPYRVSTETTSWSSSSSSSPVVRDDTNNNVSCGTKRAAEPSSPPGRSAFSQVIGWPPIKNNSRMNSLVNQLKLPASGESALPVDKCEGAKGMMDKTKYCFNRNDKDKLLPKTLSSFVKVNMDGMPIGRKVDLNAHSCYETLAHTLEDMFKPDAAVGTRRSKIGEHVALSGTRRPLRLLDGSSDFVLTYEDKEGDWMLVGDVPWEMFLSSVRRLRIRSTAAK